ncbi:unnamed protein product [Musa acuminata subsp. burmannicoides]
MDLVVGGSRGGGVRKNATVVLLNLVKNNGDKIVGDVREVDRAETIVRALVDDDSRVSMRRKSKAETLLRVLESRRGSQP